MNDIAKLRNIPIFHVLKRLNIEANEKKKEQFWFKAPWRNERTASVKCEFNLFFDFGEEYKGNTIDFVMKYFSIDFIKAVKWLRNEDFVFSFDPPKQKSISEVNKTKSYCIDRVQPLQNKILLDYLNTRKLNIEVCKRYLVEVYYRVNEKKYFGVGFKTNKDSYEIRNKYAKLALGKKWFTWINNGHKSVIVLESWSDLISLLTLYPKSDSSKDFIVLNSLSMLSKIDKVIKNYSQVFLAFDNDVAGSKGSEKCLQKYKNSKDIRYLYSESKDLNDHLISQRK
ncbi:DNA primase [Wenyingzhuangia heitensis]|uniref:DNA primase n=1 Tax=Wenyingzhuangia heitensis TaxID=1487859 RepID=A0ABX0U6F3_9FLAO|nr:toprim domain-containing protein [Wenyingzhuangia heitensis]NIJ44430.1 DNA primase [Wenyingzhuangia heitensis]